MHVTNAIFRNSAFFFILIPVFAVWGFWLTYFARPSGEVHPYEHIHGLAMFGWCLMLIVQSSLIRVKRRDIHRQLASCPFCLRL